MTTTVENFCRNVGTSLMKGMTREPFGMVPVTSGEGGGHYLPRGLNSSRVFSLRLIGINPQKLDVLRNQEPQLRMYAGLSDQQRIRVGFSGRTIFLEVPKPESLWTKVSIELLENRRAIRKGHIATLGLGLDDMPLRIYFQREDVAHVFISGQTRSGKTTAQKLIAWNLAHHTSPPESAVVIIDTAKRGLRWKSFNQVCHLVHPVITRVEEAERVLTFICQQIDKRAGQTRNKQEAKLFVFVDELKALVDESQVCSNSLSRIASIGGEFGVHLVLATQYPQIKMLGSAELKRNVTTRLCGKVDDAVAAVNALGIRNSGAEALQGCGDFLLKDSHGLTRLTTANCTDKHIDQLPRRVSVRRLPIANISDDTVYGDRPTEKKARSSPPAPDPLKSHQVALALYNEGTPGAVMGVQKLRRAVAELDGGCGLKKAQRIQAFARDLIQWGQNLEPPRELSYR
jgi:hypothetical protein